MINLDERDVPARQQLGTLPTRIERLDALCSSGCALWVKHDDDTHSLYGGNKVRKLEYLLAAARARGAERLLTFGAVGSHHVLATTIHGRAAGFRVAAVLVPQPGQPCALDNLRAGMAAGLEPFAASSYAKVAWILARIRTRRDYVIPPGGSNVLGTLGYVNAMNEIAGQIQSRMVPEPDVIVAALGSGGTIAGLLAGVVLQGLRSQVVGVHVAVPMGLLRRSTLMLARRACKLCGMAIGGRELSSRLQADTRWIGDGYACSTRWGTDAQRRAEKMGLALDPTYTAKAFACALDLLSSGRYQNVLYVHTLSGAPMEPLLHRAPDEASVPRELRALIR